MAMFKESIFRNQHRNFQGIRGEAVFQNGGEISEPSAEALGEDIIISGGQKTVAK